MVQTRSLEHRRAIGDSLRDVPKSPEHRAKISSALTGQLKTLKQRAANYASHRTPNRHSPYWWKLYRARLEALQLAQSLR